MVVIAVSGCVGSGKTTLAKKLSSLLSFSYVNLSTLRSLHKEYDKKKKCWVVDIKELRKVVKGLINKEKDLIIDGHLSHYLNKRDVDLCILVRCDLKELQKRLKKRGYSVKKIKENLECEAFDLCTVEALEQGHIPLVIRGDHSFSLETLDWIKKKCIR